jgi:hypothetical protein
MQLYKIDLQLPSDFRKPERMVVGNFRKANEIYCELGIKLFKLNIK